ncbi:LCP family protein [Bacillus cytotoxicus]|uniref:LCP family protein n=1 Tax=Bacillus cytotoxicus TaxID=580165 RepID=A0ACC6ABW2_9BACI|nr:LCP family protein [Bacillus cytotoxicus]
MDQPKKSYKKLKIAISIIVLFLICGGGYTWFLVNKASSAVRGASQNLERGEKSELREQTVKPVSNNVSVLIMGIDENQGREKQYSGAFHPDALLLATFNKDSKTVKLVSIPRDTYTYVPVEKKKDKITHSYSLGVVKNGKESGPQSTIDSVEKLFNVPVDYFVRFNFKSFIKVVNDLDGIDLDVPVTFTEQDSNDTAGAIHLEKGFQHLNGEQALALARTRKIDSDAMRGQRQQLVIEAIVKKLASAGSITKVGKIIDDINGEFKTNFSFDDMLSFYKYGINASIGKLQLAGEDCYMAEDKVCKPTYSPGHTYYYMPDQKNIADISKQLREHLGLPADTNTALQDKDTDTDKKQKQEDKQQSTQKNTKTSETNDN